MHPRIAISGLCFPTLTAVDAIEAVADLGAASTSLPATKLRESGAADVVDAERRRGVDVVAVPGFIRLDLSAGAAPPGDLERAREDIDLAAAVGATCLYGLLGRRAEPEWAASVDAYVDAVGELVDHAADRGVVLAIEPVNWLYADLTFVHTFRDAIQVADRAGMGVCLDLYHVWMEGDLRRDIADHVHLITHVQLGDLAFGDRALPSRAVPGDGDIPLATVIRWLLEAGYGGVFDCELNGPRIDDIGHRAAASRAASWLDAVLVDLGA